MLSEVRTTMNYLTRELREGKELLCPLPSDISSASIPWAAKSVVILAHTETREAAVSYFLDDATGSVMKGIYSPPPADLNGYLDWVKSPDLWVPLTEEAPNPRIIGKNIQSLVFSWEDIIPPQDANADATLNNVYSPQVITFQIKAKDDPEAPGSGMMIWSKMRLRF